MAHNLGQPCIIFALLEYCGSRGWPCAPPLNRPGSTRNDPTAKVVDLDFYAEVVDFCRYHGIWVVSDLAYAEIYFDIAPPPSSSTRL